MDDPFEPLPGLERYRLLRRLGGGAIGTVYVAEHVELGSRHAIKLLQVQDDDGVQRLLTEGRVQATLRHPNVVVVTDVVRSQGRVALVMELVDGPDLAAFLVDNRPLDLELVDALAEGILLGMRAAHAAGVLHRDLKPANILMAWTDERWTPKVADFGLAKHALDAAGATRTGQIMGTPAYMAPEQARDAKNVDERADVFSLGCILYELATGERAFPGADVFSVLAAVASGRFRPVVELRDVPERMRAAIDGALQIDPRIRIATVQELLDVWRGDVTLDRPSSPVATWDAFDPVDRAPDIPDAAPDAAPTSDPAEPVVRPALGAGWGRLVVTVVCGLVLVTCVVVWSRATRPSEEPAPTLQAFDGRVGLAPIVSVNMEAAAGAALTLQIAAVLDQRGIAMEQLPAASYDADGRVEVLEAVADRRDMTPVRGAIGRLGSVYTLNLERPVDDGDDIRVHRMASDLDALLGQLEPMLVALLVRQVGRDDGPAVRQTIQRHMGELGVCYSSILGRRPLAGTIDLAFTLTGGRPDRVRVDTDSVGDPELAACMVERVERWLFPIDLEGDVAWPFVFRPPDPTPEDRAQARRLMPTLLPSVEDGPAWAMLADALRAKDDAHSEAMQWTSLRRRVEAAGLPWVLAGVPDLSSGAGVEALESAWARPAIAAHPQRRALTALALRLGEERVEELIAAYGDEVMEELARCEACGVDAMGRYWVFRTAARAHRARCAADPQDAACRVVD